jgi:hypothetical protein
MPSCAAVSTCSAHSNCCVHARAVSRTARSVSRRPSTLS